MYDPEHQAYKNLADEEKKENCTVIVLYSAHDGVKNLHNLYKELLPNGGFERDYSSDENKAFADIIRWGSESCTEEQKEYAGVPDSEKRM